MTHHTHSQAASPPPAFLKSSLSPKRLLSFLHRWRTCSDKQLFTASEPEKQLPWNAGPLQIGSIYIFTSVVMSSVTDAKEACDVYHYVLFSCSHVQPVLVLWSPSFWNSGRDNSQRRVKVATIVKWKTTELNKMLCRESRKKQKDLGSTFIQFNVQGKSVKSVKFHIPLLMNSWNGTQWSHYLQFDKGWHSSSVEALYKLPGGADKRGHVNKLHYRRHRKLLNKWFL